MTHLRERDGAEDRALEFDEVCDRVTKAELVVFETCAYGASVG